MATEEMTDQLKSLVRDLRTEKMPPGPTSGGRDPEAMAERAATAIEQLFAERSAFLELAQEVTRERDQFLDALIAVRAARDAAQQDLRNFKGVYAELSIQLLSTDRSNEQLSEQVRELEVDADGLNAKLAPVIAALRDWAENENPTIAQAHALATAWNTWKDNA